MKRFLLLLLASAFLATSCDKSEAPEIPPTPPPDVPEQPEISLDRAEPVYSTKVNEPLLLAPIVTNAGNNPSYRWAIEDETVGEEASFTFVGTEKGSVYITFEVIAEHGRADIELRVDVMPLKFPAITMFIPPNGFSILAGAELPLTPEVNNAEETLFEWTVNGAAVSADKDYTFTETEPGDYTVKFTASNDDGTDFKEFNVKVCTEEQMSFEWAFEQTAFNVSIGRTVFIRPYRVENEFDAVYTWKVNGEEVDAPWVDTQYAGPAPACLFAFTPPAQGEHIVEVTMTNSYKTVSQEFTVNCCPSEGTYRRTAAGSAKWSKVYEFLAAPGQFVNKNYTAMDMAAACSYAGGRMDEDAYVSLGAFGGYIVVGFDHSISNDGGYNIQINGNSFTGSSEPGIVWVMQDENGDGQPNDTWYELKGSEYGKSGTRLDYAVTYYRPAAPALPVMWTDNEGGSGQVDYMIAYHRQDYYYPLWVGNDSYTLIGRKLESRTEMVSINYWIFHDFDWGYADNFSFTDRLTDDANSVASMNSNHFKISDAVTYDGTPANLGYVDFVKVQTALQTKANRLGENSTEVFGVNDFNMLK